MDTIDSVRLLVELEGEHCGLNHGPKTRPEDYLASDYIVIPFGDTQKEIHIADRNLVVPVCLDCAQALTGNEWTLFYCFECNTSHWVNRNLAKNNYRHHILWLKGCPDCTNKFGGLYFNDAANNTINDQLLAHLNRKAA